MLAPIRLGPPPEFGSDGSPPPLSSAPLIVVTETFSVVSGPASSRGATNTKLVIGAGAVAGVAAGALVVAAAPVAGAAALAALVTRRSRASRRAPDHAPPTVKTEPRRLVYSQCWRRDDPTVQLAPGAGMDLSYTITAGVAQTATRELSMSLGLGVKNPADLSGQLGAKFGVQLTLTAQQTLTKTLKLTNDTPDRYRRFARWSVVHRLEVLDAGDRVLNAIEVIDDDAANLTSAHVDLPAAPRSTGAAAGRATA